MTIRVGDEFPDVTLNSLTPEGMKEISTAELCAGRRVVIFGVPGAFTPTCSDSHLPGFISRAADIRAAGVDAVACVAVNDAFVMAAWGKSQNAGDEVLMLADGNGELGRALGLEVDLSGFGMGRRTRRFAAIVGDGTVELLNVETGPGIERSSAETVLAAL
ncbi:MAG: peroxiredoxin [Thermoanaerobaculia bacterium]